MSERADAAARLFWRTLEEREGDAVGLGTPEFPPDAEGAPEALTRRDFVKLLAAGAALAGTTACGLPDQRILPYVRVPAGLEPGVPRHYATSMLLDGYATGLLVESHAGRPTKVEGNPDHPASLGAAGPHEQAAILGLYDPARARTLTYRGARRGAPALLGELARIRPPGTGLRFLLEPTSSPLLDALIARLRAAFPEARFTFWAPLAAVGAGEGARAAFGRPLLPQYDFARATTILALDADLLAGMPFHLRYARQWAGRRAAAGAPTAAEPNRLYAVESTLTVTGAAADHRLPVRPEQVGEVLAAVGAALAAQGVAAPGVAAGPHTGWARAAAADLAAPRGAGVLVVGERQPAHVHALAQALNQALGNVGRTVWLTATPLVDAPGAVQPLDALASELRAGRVQALVMLGANPVHTAPPDLGLAEALNRASLSVYHGLYRDETARAAGWFVPAAHFLESWGDGRAYDGTASLVQPLIKPLWGGWTEAQLLAALLPGTGTAGAPPDAHALLREAWRAQLADEAAWEMALRKGVVEGTAFPPETVGGAAPWVPPAPRAATSPGLAVEFRPSPAVHDGRFAENAWLQELPDPITKLTWGNAALLSPATAARLGLATGDVATLELRGRAVDAPVFVLPGQADDTVTLPLGYGRRAGEGIAAGVGFDAYALRGHALPFADTGLVVRKTGRREELASTQAHWSLHGRPIVLAATLDEYRADPRFARAQQGPTPSLYDAYRYAGGSQWAMVIDTSICTGCSACVVACQAENNVPVVGKADVLKHREMHWLRVDRYFAGDPGGPRLVMQPMLCQHCEHAPCEYVCPVEATVHSPEGLNEMVYNRCVGTRFCSNNCPYKVRRFNWFNYNKGLSETEKLGKNPDVTVRARGVMEKCSFCVQRIERAEIQAGVEGRALRPGEVVTACQQACPTRAITFGSYTDPTPALAAALAEPRRYAVLHDLGTRPRVTYLADITNPNGQLGDVAAAGGTGISTLGATEGTVESESENENESVASSDRREPG